MTSGKGKAIERCREVLKKMLSQIRGSSDECEAGKLFAVVCWLLEVTIPRLEMQNSR